MIKTLIFDFGDVFINLDKQGAMQKALNLFNMATLESGMLDVNIKYEVGHISTSEFIKFYTSKFPNLNESDVVDAWNTLILLSNTNDLHINYIKQNVSFYEDFKNCFDVFYLSQEIHLRKPNADIFEFVLKENKLIANECLFIDDTKDNTDTAGKLGFHIWNIDETKEDVVDLFKIKKDLF